MNADGTIDLTDRLYWNTFTGSQLYNPSDTDLDGQVNHRDKNDFWFINQAFNCQVPE